MFAIEMTRAVLAQEPILAGFNLSVPWMHMDMEMGNDDHKVFTILLKLYGFHTQIESSGEIFGEYGVGWLHGTCSITLVDIDPDRHWDFSCELRDDTFVITPS